MTIPFSRKITFIVGPNNSGKSNILRALGVLFNKAYDRISDSDDFDTSDKKIHLSISVSREVFQKTIGARRHARGVLESSNFDNLVTNFDLSRAGNLQPKGSDDIERVFGNYIRSRDFLDDFGRSGDNNLDIFLQTLQITELFKGTTYVPNVRFITQINQEPPQFVNWAMPGTTIAFGKVIARLAEMDRPDPEHRRLREHMLRIQDFMAHCLEKRSVKLEVPDSKKTILVNIDGDERPISSFGTGVEQLIMIGVASLGFDEKLVLIDEPELNLHPRAQKRIVNYLDAHVKAQFVIATHSAAILDAAEADVIQVTNSGTGTISRTIQRNRERYEAVRDLGHSPSELLQTKFAIWVEGPSDRLYVSSWIKRIDQSLVEGIDYSILFYGGKILSHHSFADEDSDLVKAVSLSRAFAVIMDSDRKPARPNINRTKTRVRDEVEREGGLFWITEGREIENYVPKAVIEAVSGQMNGVSVPQEKRDQVLDPDKANKMDFARLAIAHDNGEWPLDLKLRVTELVEEIRKAQ